MEASENPSVAGGDNSNARSFVVVLGAESAARFNENEGLEIPCSSPLGPLSVRLRTNYAHEGYESRVPRGLLIEANGTASSIDEAIKLFASKSEFFPPLLALATNAAVKDLTLAMAFEVTPGVNEREFFQNFVQTETGTLPIPSRPVPIDAFSELLEAIASHSERDRIQRAIAQYHHALKHWDPADNIISLAHIYMGLEALTKAYLRRECTARNLDEEHLAEAVGVEKKVLDAWVRRVVLFRGDDECYGQAKDASDGFEHGFLELQKVRSLATESRDKAARYLRDAILDLAGGDGVRVAVARSEKYAEPLGAGALVKTVRGILVGSAERLAADGEAYPIVHWKTSLKEFRRTETGEFQATPAELLSCRLAPGITLEKATFEICGPSVGGWKVIDAPHPAAHPSK